MDSLQKHAKIAGWSYFLIILTSVLMLIFVEPRVTVFGDQAATLNNIMENEIFLRINNIYQLFMFSAVILLAVMLFEVLKKVNAGLARTAMLLRAGEALIGFLSVFCSFMAIIILKKETFASEFRPEQVNALAVVFLDGNGIANDIIMLLISLGTVIFCWLFYKSKMIPDFISLWGIAGFTLMIFAAVLKTLAISFASTVNMIAAVLVILFEFTIGLWLMIKGVKEPVL